MSLEFVVVVREEIGRIVNVMTEGILKMANDKNLSIRIDGS
jgi:hypothetical protein